MKKIPSVLQKETVFKPYAAFPLSIQLCCDYRVHGNKPHRHEDFYELVIVLDGSAINVNNQASDVLQPGNILFFPPASVHYYDKIKDFNHYNILFEPSYLEKCPVDLKTVPGYRNFFNYRFSGEDSCSAVLSVNQKVLSKLILMLEGIRNEFLVASPGWMESVYFEFMHMFIYMMRFSVLERNSIDPNVHSISSVIHLMDEDCTREHSLKSLADEVNMSVSSFRHHFAAVTGMPPGKYLLRLRLRKALLLLASPSSVVRVAELSGFTDCNYFIRQFRKKIGLTPTRVRQMIQQREATVQDFLDRLDE